MEKSPDAFRTISEVSAILDTPAHVLRFWESRFPQVKPVKRAGGRRYYRPSDLALLSGIRQLLHDDGMTIRGVQKLLREQGVRHVANLGGGSDDGASAITSPEEKAPAAAEKPAVPAPTPTSAEVTENPLLSISRALSGEKTVPPQPLPPRAVPPSKPDNAFAATPPAAPPSVVVPLSATMTIPGLPLPDIKPAAPDQAAPAAGKPRNRKAPSESPEAPMLFDAPLLPQESRVTPFAEAARARAASGVAADASLTPSNPPKGDSGKAPPSVLRPGLADAPKQQATVDTLDIDDGGLPPDPWLPSLLRRLPQARLAPHTEALTALHARLTVLRAKTHAAAHPSQR
jgi:resuscitation-promoting factor RpfA